MFYCVRNFCFIFTSSSFNSPAYQSAIANMYLKRKVKIMHLNTFTYTLSGFPFLALAMFIKSIFHNAAIQTLFSWLAINTLKRIQWFNDQRHGLNFRTVISVEITTMTTSMIMVMMTMKKRFILRHIFNWTTKSNSIHYMDSKRNTNHRAENPIWQLSASWLITK